MYSFSQKTSSQVFIVFLWNNSLSVCCCIKGNTCRKCAHCGVLSCPKAKDEINVPIALSAVQTESVPILTPCVFRDPFKACKRTLKLHSFPRLSTLPMNLALFIYLFIDWLIVLLHSFPSDPCSIYLSIYWLIDWLIYCIAFSLSKFRMNPAQFIYLLIDCGKFGSGKGLQQPHEEQRYPVLPNYVKLLRVRLLRSDAMGAISHNNFAKAQPREASPNLLSISNCLGIFCVRDQRHASPTRLSSSPEGRDAQSGPPPRWPCG